MSFPMGKTYNYSLPLTIVRQTNISISLYIFFVPSSQIHSMVTLSIYLYIYIDCNWSAIYIIFNCDLIIILYLYFVTLPVLVLI